MSYGPQKLWRWGPKSDSNSQFYPSSLGGTVYVFGHCNYGDDEKDNGGSHTSHEILGKKRNSSDEALKKNKNVLLCFISPMTHHQRPEEAFEPLIEFSGVGKQQEESSQELQHRDGHKSCCCGCREAHKRYKGKNLWRQLKKRKISRTPTLWLNLWKAKSRFLLQSVFSFWTSWFVYVFIKLLSELLDAEGNVRLLIQLRNKMKSTLLPLRKCSAPPKL